MSAEPALFSEQWYRVSALRPRLAPDLRLERHRVRGESWWILASADGRRSHRLDAVAYALAGRCTGRCTVQQIWDLLNQKLGDAAPTQDDVIQILSRLHAEGWLAFDTRPDLAGLVTERNRKARARRSFNPLALRIPMGDPHGLLARLDPLARVIVSRPMLVLWFVMMLAAGIVAVTQFDALVAHGAKWLVTPRYLVITWCVYPVIKLVHELAHGLAVRRWGGQVRQAGITLLLLTPVPFVDASAANLFPRAAHRAFVSMAGVMAELALAAIALLLWMVLGAGLPRDIAFITMVIGCVSTLAVNANPLLRFDGYFAASDLLGLPNLAPRSRAWWSGMLRDRLLRIPGEPMRMAPGERKWLIAYAPLSWCYQLVIALIIARWMAGFAPLAGAITALAFVALLIGRPLLALWRFLADGAGPAGMRRSALARALIAAGAVVGLVALLPLPDRTVAEGVVWLPERALLRAAEDGFVDEFLAADGTQVQAGQVLARMSNPAASAEYDRLVARREGLRARQYAAMSDDAGAAEQHREAVDLVDAELARTIARLESLELRAGASGRLVMPRQADLIGAFARRGQLLAYVLTDEAAIVRIAVPQERTELIRVAGQQVQVRFAHSPGTRAAGSTGPGTLAAEQRLPSAALSSAHGGAFVTDPADKENRRTLSPVVVLDVRLAESATTQAWLGERAWVRFEHGYRPMLLRWARNVQQSFLQRAHDPA